MSHAEQPDYKLVKSEENIEIRDYPSMILAEVETSGERKEAIREGFKLLADYIFGNNIPSVQIDVHKPAPLEYKEKIAMMAPVLQERHKDKWKVRFVMPKKYTLETLPKPIDKKILLKLLPASRFAAIRFSGILNDKKMHQHAQELQAYLLANNLQACGGIILAFYDPPWTLPLLRRNEILIEIKKE